MWSAPSVCRMTGESRRTDSGIQPEWTARLCIGYTCWRWQMPYVDPSIHTSSARRAAGCSPAVATRSLRPMRRQAGGSVGEAFTDWRLTALPYSDPRSHHTTAACLAVACGARAAHLCHAVPSAVKMIVEAKDRMRSTRSGSALVSVCS